MQDLHEHMEHDSHHLNNCRRKPTYREDERMKSKTTKKCFMTIQNLSLRKQTFQLHSIVYSRLQTWTSEESIPLELSILEQLPSHSFPAMSESVYSIDVMFLSKLISTNGPQTTTFNGTRPNS